MLFNNQNLLFQFHSKFELKNEMLTVTDTQKSSNTSASKKSCLSAKWYKENGKLVCKWIIN
jgi:hypothetical protein